MKHSPGPWTAECVGVTSPGPNGIDIYEVTNGYKRICEYLTEPDAKLVAAAPELLNTLIALREFCHVVATEAADRNFRRIGHEHVSMADVLIEKVLA